MYKTIKQYLQSVKKDRIAIIDGEAQVTYKTLLSISENIAQVVQKDRTQNIAIFLPNGKKFVFAFFGTLLSGKTAFPLSINLTKNELASIIKFTKIKSVITSSEFVPIFDGLGVNIFDIDNINCIKKILIPERDGKKPLILLNTSGTTDNKKVVMLSESNIVSNVNAYISKMNYSRTKGQKYVLLLPFSSAYGIMILLAIMMKSFTLVLTKAGSTLAEILKICHDNKVEMCECGSPIILILNKLAYKLPAFDYPSYFGFGGSKVSGEIIESLYKRYPDKQFMQGYGMTECSPLIAKFYNNSKLNKFNSVGQSVKGGDIKILTDNSIATKPRQVGEILFKGPGVMMGYYKNSKQTRKMFYKGYLKTGDIGYLDEQNFLYLCGRKKNIVIIRGYNVVVEEVEEILLKSGLVKECKVYGKDFNGDEALCADIVVSKNIAAKDIFEFCKLNLSEYKVPKQINFVKSLERNEMGKLKRNAN